MTTHDDIAARNYAAQMAHTGRVQLPTKKTYKKPEADVAKKIDDYLALIGCINIRTNAGAWQDDQGNYIMGAKGGTSDKTCCTPHGCFLAIETKAPKKGLRPNQEAYQAKVEAHGGTYVAPHSVDELRAGLRRAYGPQRVAAWEDAGRARAAAKKDAIEAVRERNRS